MSKTNPNKPISATEFNKIVANAIDYDQKVNLDAWANTRPGPVRWNLALRKFRNDISQKTLDDNDIAKKMIEYGREWMDDKVQATKCEGKRWEKRWEKCLMNADIKDVTRAIKIYRKLQENARR